MRDALALVLSAALAACTDSDASGRSELDAGQAAATSGVAWRSAVFVWASGSFAGPPPLAGVEVCVEEGAPQECVTTGEDGVFTLRGLPPSHPILIVYKKEDFVPIVQAIVTPRSSTQTMSVGWSVRMSRRDGDMFRGVFDAARADAGRPPLPQDWETRGQVAFGRYSRYALGLAPGALAALEPASEEEAFSVGGRFSFDESSAVLGPSAEGALYGVYANVEPGEYELVWNDASGDCKWAPGANSSWPAASGRENAARIVVRAGHETAWTALNCPIDAEQWYADWEARNEPESDAGVDAGGP